MLTILVGAIFWVAAGFCTLAAMWKIFGYVYDDQWGWVIVFWPYFVFLMAAVIFIVEFYEDEE